MEFGRVASIEGIDLRLPPDDPATAAVLQARARGGGLPGDPGAGPGARGGGRPEVYVGLPLWNADRIAEQLCPEGAPKHQRLACYARAYNAIELNSSGYALSARNAAAWAAQVPEGFRFCPKVPRDITHGADLRRAGGLYEDFVQAAMAFGDKLGTALLQFNERDFGPWRFRELEAFLRAHGRRLPLAVEVRHREWFSQPAAREALFGLLAELGLVAVIVDVPARRDLLHQRLTVPEAFVRFGGHDRGGRDLARIGAWADRLKAWMDLGLRRLHFFPHHIPEWESVAWADDFVAACNRAQGSEVIAPRALPEKKPEPQLDLFGS